jgi:hypothetical protein
MRNGHLNVRKDAMGRQIYTFPMKMLLQAVSIRREAGISECLLGGGKGRLRKSCYHLLSTRSEDDMPLLIHFDITDDYSTTGGPAVDRHKPVLRQRVKGCLPRMGHMTDVI